MTTEIQALIAMVFTVSGYIIWNVRRLTTRIDNTMSEPQIRGLVADKIEIVKVSNDAIKERLKSLEVKIDRLLDLQCKK